ncbi:2-C-methyl-D-erythritol 4-phosphate cytidylyltransferase [Kineosporia babensis]|uniref:2-C-methyl-D-erythritol 4-phosphate cytidylyltransferase n=1 Tax=Kineosporia babensis TaxID=499548 RepID=A0A9X1N8T5_9ACTN|nr:2-C-methyl-D-erythritol 4-phosphate cytidylyltransferase [Kineosporia babensis]MCD5309274.1 2-C-methyl-D-erythritol 4-phosphate cytidylyltransferase [Kineosporia babensis]
MPTAFVAVIQTGRIPDDLSGATAVHTLRDLAACPQPDDAPAVLLDPASDQSAQVTALLQTLETVDAGDAAGGLVVTSVRPVTDTLKRVGAGGALAGTADRENHRFVTAPIATRLGLLRAAVERQPQASTAGEILASLVAVGATVVTKGA